MAEELQHLIDRIRKEAVDQAEAQAAQLTAQAREKAAALVRDAEQKAAALLQKAEKDSEVFVERGRRTLEQAARDLLITVGQGVENILEDLVQDAVEQALDQDTIKQMLLKLVQAYTGQAGGESRIEVLVSPEDQKAIIQFFADQYRQKLVHGVEIHTDNKIFKGFRVAVVDRHIRHEFTKAAIAEALSAFLRPHLAEIVHKAARVTEPKA